MQTVTLQINNNAALKTLQELENKHFISIVQKTELDIPSLPGSPLSLIEFRQWVSDAENSSSVSLNDAKEIWASKRKQLRNLIK